MGFAAVAQGHFGIDNVLTPPAPKKDDLLARLAIGFLVASGGG
jgi:hypothetical protein